MGGKAVIVLLADGEWGLWDIEGDGSAGGSKGILGRQSIKGGAITAFSISGWIDSAPVKSSSTKGATARTSNSKFAPMTPSTRKTVEPVLFSGRSGHGFARGKISVVRLPATSTISLAEESVAFWLEDSYCVIPNLRAYWDAQSRRNGGGSGNLFGVSNPMSRMIRLEGVNLRGERCCGIDQHPREFNLEKSPTHRDTHSRRASLQHCVRQHVPITRSQTEGTFSWRIPGNGLKRSGCHRNRPSTLTDGER